MLREHGISVWGSFVFGFDTDDPEVFERTVEFAIEMQLTMANFAMLCPYPGTRALPPARSPRAGSPIRSGGCASTTRRRGRTSSRSA